MQHQPLSDWWHHDSTVHYPFWLWSRLKQESAMYELHSFNSVPDTTSTHLLILLIFKADIDLYNLSVTHNTLYPLITTLFIRMSQSLFVIRSISVRFCTAFGVHATSKYCVLTQHMLSSLSAVLTGGLVYCWQSRIFKREIWLWPLNSRGNRLWGVLTSSLAVSVRLSLRIIRPSRTPSRLNSSLHPAISLSDCT